MREEESGGSASRFPARDESPCLSGRAGAPRGEDRPTGTRAHRALGRGRVARRRNSRDPRRTWRGGCDEQGEVRNEGWAREMEAEKRGRCRLVTRVRRLSTTAMLVPPMPP